MWRRCHPATALPGTVAKSSSSGLLKPVTKSIDAVKRGRHDRNDGTSDRGDDAGGARPGRDRVGRAYAGQAGGDPDDRAGLIPMRPKTRDGSDFRRQDAWAATLSIGVIQIRRVYSQSVFRGAILISAASSIVIDLELYH
jgi:hypothetical protein